MQNGIGTSIDEAEQLVSTESKSEYGIVKSCHAHAGVAGSHDAYAMGKNIQNKGQSFDEGFTNAMLISIFDLSPAESN